MVTYFLYVAGRVEKRPENAYILYGTVVIYKNF